MLAAQLRALRATPLVLGLVAAAVLAGCQEEDTGACCRALSEEGRMALPTPDPAGTGGIPKDLVGRHPAYDCDALTCVSWQGSDPFCSRRCSADRPCPEGFDCQPVLQSSPGAEAQIQPGDTFCVRKTCNADGDCPEDFTCVTLRMGGADPQTDPSVKHCMRSDDACK